MTEEPARTESEILRVESAPESSDLLWHYTDADGLLGILNSKALWGTDALYLNDTRELLEAHELQLAHLREDDPRENSRIDLTVYRAFMHDLAEILRPLEGVFITSFSAADDLLSQWRGYTGGPGYAVGFSREKLANWADRSGVSLVAVTYGSPDAKLSSLLKPRGVMVSGTGEAFLDSDSAAVAGLKHPAFAEEREWRVVATAGSRELKFRATRHGLAPYVELPIDLALISEIKLGPGLAKETAVRAVQRLLAAKGAKAKVSVSNVPFRP